VLTSKLISCYATILLESELSIKENGMQLAIVRTLSFKGSKLFQTLL
jgi:hypothetical protein